MKKYNVTFLLISLYLSANAQYVITDIKNNANIINLGYSGIESVSLEFPDMTVKNVKFQDLISIVKLNVVNYFQLSEIYDSDLKIKVYSQSEDYKIKFNELKELRDYIVNRNIYLSIQKDCYSKYDINKKSFEFSTNVLKDKFFSTKYLQFDDLCLTKPINFKYEEGITTYGGPNVFYYQDFNVPVLKESAALDIENNCERSKIMFVFKILNVQRGNGVFGFEDFLICNTKNVLIYNDNTEEIYVQYKY